MKILVGIVLAVIVLFLVFGVGILFPLNTLIPQNPDLSCNTDSDCGLWPHPAWSECSVCLSCQSFDASDPSVIAVNKNWKLSCPFPRPALAGCILCIGELHPDETIQAKCIQNKCQKVVSN
jgi:hypothetical protein